MYIHGRELLGAFMKRHAQSRKALSTWVDEVERATWRDSHEVKRQYPTADPLGAMRVVFNIKGNDYRLVAVLVYGAGTLDIRFIGTHAEYDRINAARI